MKKKTKNREKMFGIYLYVLELQNGKYYIGITSNPNKRFNAHKNGRSSIFIRENLPIIKIHKTKLYAANRRNALKEETKKTIELINQYGIINVCGGSIIGDYNNRIIQYEKYLSNLIKKT